MRQVSITIFFLELGSGLKQISGQCHVENVNLLKNSEEKKNFYGWFFWRIYQQAHQVYHTRLVQLYT